MYQKLTHNRFLRLAMALVGSFLLAFSVNIFISPHQLYSGGLYGVCQLVRTLLSMYAGLTVTEVDLAGILYLLVNIPLLWLGYRSFGRAFSVKLILGTVTNSLFLALIPIPATPMIADELTSCLVGGILSGFACGLVLTCGASCGGLDILGLYLSKKNKGFTVGRFSIGFNAVLYLACILLFDVSTAIYSAIYTVFCSLFIDRVHKQNITVQVLIFTKRHDPGLPAFIMEKLERGVTYWEAFGGYTGDSVRVLCVCLSKYEIETLQTVMHELDPNAFFIVQQGVQIGGNFERHLT